MKSNCINQPRVLAIAPCVQGIGFVVFNGPRLPIDWGIKWTRDDKNAKGIEKVAELIDCYQPDIVVSEDYRGEGSRRAKRIEELLDAIAALVRQRGIRTASYSRDSVRQLFSTDGAATKYRIAKAIAGEIPELAPRLPGERKIWLPEHANMSIFDAASLALTYFSTVAEKDGSEFELAA
jgi:Holliday junction resolvasome RuvABC endonuclease subunit